MCWLVAGGRGSGGGGVVSIYHKNSEVVLRYSCGTQVPKRAKQANNGWDKSQLVQGNQVRNNKK